jgi:hypothetical protein
MPTRRSHITAALAAGAAGLASPPWPRPRVQDDRPAQGLHRQQEQVARRRAHRHLQAQGRRRRLLRDDPQDVAARHGHQGGAITYTTNPGTPGTATGDLTARFDSIGAISLTAGDEPTTIQG